MILPIAVASAGYMNAIGESPLCMATDGYLNNLSLRPRVMTVGGRDQREVRIADDNEIMFILERIFGDITC